MSSKIARTSRASQPFSLTSFCPCRHLCIIKKTHNLLFHPPGLSHVLLLLTPIHLATNFPSKNCLLPFPKPKSNYPSGTNQLRYCPFFYASLFTEMTAIRSSQMTGQNKQKGRLINCFVLFHIHLCPQKQTWLKNSSVLPGFQTAVGQHREPSMKLNAQVAGWEACRKGLRAAWGEALSPMVQQVTDRFTAAARVKSSCQGRDAQRLYLRELWVHLASRSNPQVPASSPTSLTSASLSSKSNKTLPCNQHKDKRYLSHCYSMILLRCLALMSREKASPQGAEMRRQNRLFHLLTDVRGDAPD